MAFTLPSENKDKSSKSGMDEIAVVLRRFGDEQSALLDQFERLSFEVQLNKAILRRSFSEPSVGGAKLPAPLPPSDVAPKAQTQVGVKGRRRGVSGFGKVLKKMLKSFVIKRGSSNKNGGRKEVPDPKSPKYLKAFSRSLRL
ncbi:hypothetical protein Pint_35069 [Pistacia integerrima]|uniref:Uncharacterized protein n=1 Tax=Pistacia integerrima TaxID=434235 RepID=A0ACC0Y347_9ROSI|nr:hypothetical protein Pint_35069 [Pistacia integerrima]